MARSLLVILALVFGLFIIVPRGDRIEQPPIDEAAKAAYTAKVSGWPLESPQPLPDGWKSTTATYGKGNDGVQSYTAVFQSPGGTFVSVRQAKQPNDAWFDEVLGGSTEKGTSEVAGRQWQRRWWSEKSRWILVAKGDLTVVVTGSGSLDEVEQFVARLRPVTPEP